MKYMLMIYGNKDYWNSFSEEDFAKIVVEHAAFDKEIRESGEYVSGEGLAFEDEAKVVRVRDGAQVVTDGPYLESREFLGSFYMVDCETPERAYDLAARLPAARANGVEVWPVMGHAGEEM
jgi:hypothetical protein